MNSYSAGDALGGAIPQLTSLYYLSFLLLVVEMNPFLAGLVVAIGRIWDGITDPVMGVIVDRTRTRFGSCRPFFLLATVPIFAGNVLLWSAFGIQGQASQFAYFTFAYMFYTSALTIGIVPYEALLPKIVDSYKERISYSSLRMIYSGIMCVLVVYIYELMIPVSGTNPLSPAFQDKFTVMGIVIGVIFALPLVITFFGTKEKNLPPLDLNKKSFKETLKEILVSYKQVLSSKTFRKYFYLTLLAVFISASVLATLAIFVYVLYGNIENFVLTFTLLFVVINLKGAVEIAFFVPNVIMMKKKSKHMPYLVDLPLLAVACVIVLFVSPTTPIWLFLLAMCFLGAGFSCLGFVPMSLLPDLTDVYELMYGKRAEGINAGLNTLGKKLVSGITVALFGFILGAFGLNSGDLTYDGGEVSSGTLTALKIMFCALPIVASVIMVAISRTYRLDEKRHNMIKALILKMNETGESEATAEEILEVEKITGKKWEEMWIGEK